MPARSPWSRCSPSKLPAEVAHASGALRRRSHPARSTRCGCACRAGPTTASRCWALAPARFLVMWNRGDDWQRLRDREERVEAARAAQAAGAARVARGARAVLRDQVELLTRWDDIKLS